MAVVDAWRWTALEDGEIASAKLMDEVDFLRFFFEFSFDVALLEELGPR